MAWGLAASNEFGQIDKFPFVTTLTQPLQSIGFCVLQVLANFGWNIVSILYSESEIPYCSTLVDSFVTAVSDPANTFIPTIAVKQVLDLKNTEAYSRALRQAQQLILFCMDLALEKRAFLAKISDAGMITDEYVYIMLSMRSQAFGQTGIGHQIRKFLQVISLQLLWVVLLTQDPIGSKATDSHRYIGSEDRALHE
ncbi:hypothetical protein COOONC_22643 [Cooperia oncophora]